MKIVCIDGGLTSRYFCHLMMKLKVGHNVPVVERNPPTTRSAAAWCSRTPQWTRCAPAAPSSRNSGRTTPATEPDHQAVREDTHG